MIDVAIPPRCQNKEIKNVKRAGKRPLMQKDLMVPGERSFSSAVFQFLSFLGVIGQELG